MSWIPQKTLHRRQLRKGSKLCVVTSDISCVFKVIEHSEKRVIFSLVAGHPLAKKYPILILKKKNLKQGGFATLHEEKGGGKITLRNILSLSLLPLPVILNSTMNSF